MLPFFVQCGIVGFFGLVISTLTILRSLSIKAKMANVLFNSAEAIKNDWFTPVITLVALVTALIFLPYAKPEWPRSFILGFFALLGYSGNDLVSRLFSVANKKINAAIDYKTTISDTATGTLDSPTPAAPLKKSDL